MQIWYDSTKIGDEIEQNKLSGACMNNFWVLPSKKPSQNMPFYKILKYFSYFSNCAYIFQLVDENSALYKAERRHE